MREWEEGAGPWTQESSHKRWSLPLLTPKPKQSDLRWRQAGRQSETQQGNRHPDLTIPHPQSSCWYQLEGRRQMSLLIQSLGHRARHRRVESGSGGRWRSPAQQYSTQHRVFPEPCFSFLPSSCQHSFPDGSDGKESAWNTRDLGSIPGSGRSPGEGNGNPLQYYCLENSMDRRAWRSQGGSASLWGHKKSDTTEWLTLFPLATYCHHVLSFPSTKSATGWTTSFKVV